MSRARWPIGATAALLVRCAGDPDSDLGAGVQGVEVVGVNTIDMAEYMFADRTSNAPWA